MVLKNSVLIYEGEKKRDSRIQRVFLFIILFFYTNPTDELKELLFSVRDWIQAYMIKQYIFSKPKIKTQRNGNHKRNF